MKKILLIILLAYTGIVSAFTDAEILTLRAVVSAEPSIQPCVTAGNDGCVAVWLNSPSTFVVWRTSVKKDEIFDAVVWANFTPNNPGAGAGQDASNWLMACQGKALNLQTLLNQDFIDATKINVRAGLQDATTNIPSGPAGASRTGGWTAINLAMQRNATIAEKALATGTGTTVSPGLLTFKGSVSDNSIYLILGR